MNICSVSEGRRWLADAGLPDPDVSATGREYLFERCYRMPTDAGHKTAVARALCLIAATEPRNGMLWITATGIWPSSENPELFYALRRSMGENRDLSEAPCHIFAGGDEIALECLLDLVLYFFWDSVLYLPSTKIIVESSHDEFLDLYSTSEEAMDSNTKPLAILERA